MKGLNKKQIITIICFIFVFSGIIGWIYEFFFYYLNSNFETFYFRGKNFLPWINIYMYGSFLILGLTYPVKKNPLFVFLISMLSTGILEYFSGYILYGLMGLTKCWDYNQEILNFGNINGYVCLRSVLVFGIAGLLLVYLLEPMLIKFVKTHNIKPLLIISITLVGVVLFDEMYNFFIYRLFDLPNSISIYERLGLKYLYFS